MLTRVNSHMCLPDLWKWLANYVKLAAAIKYALRNPLTTVFPSCHFPIVRLGSGQSECVRNASLHGSGFGSNKGAANTSCDRQLIGADPQINSHFESHHSTPNAMRHRTTLLVPNSGATEKSPPGRRSLLQIMPL